MEKKDFMAEQAKKWNEELTENAFIKELHSIGGKLVTDEKGIPHWEITSIPKKRIDEIINSGDIHDVTSLIECLQRTSCPPEVRINLPPSNHPLEVWFDDQQIMKIIQTAKVAWIVIDRLSRDHAFPLEVQRMLLASNDEHNIIEYVRNQPIAAELQKRLFDVVGPNVINSHQRRYGWSEELMAELKAQQPSREEQIQLLKGGATAEFKKFVLKYPFAKEVQSLMVHLRTEEEIIYYLNRWYKIADGDLQGDAATNLAMTNFNEAKKSFINGRSYSEIQPFFIALMRQKELDYQLVAQFFMGNSRTYSVEGKCAQQIELMKNGSHEEVIEFIKKNNSIDLVVLGQLFFRNNEEEFDYFRKKFFGICE